MENFEKSCKRSWIVLEFQKPKRMRTLSVWQFWWCQNQCIFLLKFLPRFQTVSFFFFSFRLKKIESCKYDGSDRREIANIMPHHPFGLGVFEDHLYYTDWFKFGKGIRKINKFTGGDKEKIKPTLWSHMDIHVYHPLRQPNGE